MSPSNIESLEFTQFGGVDFGGHLTYTMNVTPECDIWKLIIFC